MKAILLLATLFLTVQRPYFELRKVSEVKAGSYEANAIFLEFTSHPMAPVMNPILKSKAMSEHRRWLHEAKKSLEEMGKPTNTWSHEIGMDIAYNTPSLVSVIVAEYDYSGGAHPNHGVEVFNFGVIEGKARQVFLKDFFVSGFNPDPFVSKLVIAKLKKMEGADWVISGELKKLDKKMIQRFSPGKNGMTWYFNPYDVGSYASGDFEVKLSLKELGPKFNRGMLQ